MAAIDTVRAPLIQSKLEGIRLSSRGKVRDMYDLSDALLIVATDRLSAFDVVLPTGIPDKGKILTQMSLFWFDFTMDIIENHLITADVKKYPAALQPYASQLEGRSMLVKKAKTIPIECVVRGYLTGSAWKEYQEKGSVCSINLPKGLALSQKFPSTLFTPSTKAEAGHDENISQAQAEALVGKETFQFLKEKSIALYEKAAAYALSRGLIIADTKFEFGFYDGKIILIDEVLTPDSSRFWFAEQYECGKPQEALDKQFVRDYLLTLSWDKTPPGPALPDDVVMKTREKYYESFSILTGRNLS